MGFPTRMSTNAASSQTVKSLRRSKYDWLLLSIKLTGFNSPSSSKKHSIFNSHQNWVGHRELNPKFKYHTLACYRYTMSNISRDQKMQSQLYQPNVFDCRELTSNLLTSACSWTIYIQRCLRSTDRSGNNLL